MKKPELPANLMVLPGVRTDDQGRSYQYGVYPSGKAVRVPAESVNGYDAGRTIPAPEPKVTLKLKGVSMTRDSKGNQIPVIFKPRRLAVVEFRHPDSAECFKEVGDRERVERIVGEEFRPLMQSPDQGKTWVAVETSPTVDWMVQYHLDEEVK